MRAWRFRALTYSNCGGITTRIKPSVSLAMVKSLLHFDSFEEAAEESKQFGLVFDVSRIASLSEESCKNVAIAANDGLIAMRNQQQAELKRVCTSVSVVDAEMDLKEEVKVFADNAVGVR